MKPSKRAVTLPDPSLQIGFALHLAEARKAYLLDALLTTVGSLDIGLLDAEIARTVPADRVRTLAGMGLRAELLFPPPLLLRANPRLLAYYRLLLGHSPKAFYDNRNGTTPFKCMEAAGTLPREAPLEALCKELVRGAGLLLEGIGARRVTKEILDDLTLLTLGPQWRGGANVRKGTASIECVWTVIRSLVGSHARKVERNRIVALAGISRRARRA